MTKSDGEYPDLSRLPRRKRTDDYLASCLYFIPEFGEAEESIESWRIVHDGLDEFRRYGYPAPVLEFVLKATLSESELDDFRTSVWRCSYGLRIPGVNDGEDDEGYYFEDHNGYTHILDVR